MFFVLLVVGLVNPLDASSSLFEPVQVHLAWGNSDDSMVVTWSSMMPTAYPLIQYSETKDPWGEHLKDYQMEVLATWEHFQSSNDVDMFDRILYYASGELTNLKRGAYYQYRVGSLQFGWSSNFIFQAKKNFEPDTPVKFILYGDLGVGDQNINTMASLQKDVASRQYEAIIHVGDFAYDLGNGLGEVGDIFMQTIEPVAAFVPYMVTQGNHEMNWVNNPGQYEKRFKMPGNTKNLWYSFTAGQIYFIAFTDEPAFHKDLNQTQEEQVAWLKNELSSIDRKEFPWVVALSHRPMYCSANMTKERLDPHGEGFIRDGIRWIRNNEDCLESAPTVRDAFEELFYESKVDLLINGHVHAYERLGPAYQNQSMGCTEETLHTCVGPKAPITIISGIPGQYESYAPASPTPLPWSLVQDVEVGYGRLTVHNSTHLYWEQVRSIDRSLVDYLWLIKP